MSDNKFKSGFVAILGRPNVGKSTLMNHLIGMKIAAVSKRAQTTRKRIQTVYTDDRGQIIFLDTPGVNKAETKLGEFMLDSATETLKTSDMVMWIIEPSSYIINSHLLFQIMEAFVVLGFTDRPALQEHIKSLFLFQE